jgi:hypothetical protein
MALLLQTHQILSNMVAIYAILAGLFAGYHFVTRRPPGGNLWGVLAIAEGLFILQGLDGFALWLAGGRAPGRPELHVLYGISTILTLPLIFTVTRNRSPGLTTALYTVGCFFIWGLAQRAVDTALH